MLLAGVSCTEYDNYEPPKETLRGSVVDSGTQGPLQVEAGNGGIRFRLLEYSWSNNPTPYFFYSRQDGTFNNTKIFKGNYNILPEGPFVPLLELDGNGNVIKDESVTMDIAGVVEIPFSVEPFLRVEWVGSPTVDANGNIEVQVRLTRGTSNPNYLQNITDVFLFINSNPYVGNNNFDNRYSTRRDFSGDEANALLGETITLRTSGNLPGNRTHYVRVGARTDYSVAGVRRYNYNEVVPVTIP